MTNINTFLSPRLRAISEITPHCKCFADIGTDHAYLPVYLCMCKKVEKAIASDIVKGPLLRAESTINKFDMNDKISVRLGPGVSTLSRNEADVVAVCGMGGLIIANILKEGRDILCGTERILLQPMTAVTELREYLLADNWSIDDEYLIEDNGKLYNILSISPNGENVKYNKVELFLGKKLIEKKPPLYAQYLDKKINKLKKMLDGLGISKSENSKEKKKEVDILLEEIIKLRKEL